MSQRQTDAFKEELVVMETASSCVHSLSDESWQTFTSWWFYIPSVWARWTPPALYVHEHTRPRPLSERGGPGWMLVCSGLVFTVTPEGSDACKWFKLIYSRQEATSSPPHPRTRRDRTPEPEETEPQNQKRQNPRTRTDRTPEPEQTEPQNQNRQNPRTKTDRTPEPEETEPQNQNRQNPRTKTDWTPEPEETEPQNQNRQNPRTRTDRTLEPEQTEPQNQNRP